MRKKLLVKNTASSLLSQLTALICGFILPRFFLLHFGSEVNGLVNSITQFLGVISFLELGVGAVVQSSLYKPLADKDNQKISCVVVSANRFFQRLAEILLVYVVALMLVYPLIANQNFGYPYTATLIVAMSISSFAQYYFGIVNSLLLNADQRGYIQYNAQTITLILNTIVCVVLISIGGTVQIVKLTSSLIYLARPLVLRIYVKQKYQIDWKIKYTEEPIKQKWNGVAQHVAAFILDGTDTLVLSIFSTLSNVSVYSVYLMIINGVKGIFLSMTSGIRALLGEFWAKQEMEQLNDFFDWVEWCIHTGVVFLFSCTVVLIVPFVQIYTKGINDVNYIRPQFAVLLTISYTVYCLQIPYHIMVLAVGHYKQTQKYFITASLINLSVSILTVYKFDIIGVSIGTLAAMTYQMIVLLRYTMKNFFHRSIIKIIKRMIIDAISMICVFVLGQVVYIDCISYIQWFYYALITIVIATTTILIINFIFYRERIVYFLGKIIRKAR